MDEKEITYETLRKEADNIYKKKVKSLLIQGLVSLIITLAFGYLTISAAKRFDELMMTLIMYILAVITLVAAMFTLNFARLIRAENLAYKNRLKRAIEKLTYQNIYTQIPDRDYYKYENNPVSFLFKK